MSFASKPQLEPQPDRRRHRRFASQLLVRIAERRSIDRQTRDYLEQVAENLSLGGLFIRTARPAPRGTKLQLELRLSTDGANAPVVRATAIVRWSRRWGVKAGMGVEFLDFESNGRDDLELFTRLAEDSPEVVRPRPVATP